MLWVAVIVADVVVDGGGEGEGEGEGIFLFVVVAVVADVVDGGGGFRLLLLLLLDTFRFFHVSWTVYGCCEKSTDLFYSVSGSHNGTQTNKRMARG